MKKGKTNGLLAIVLATGMIFPAFTSCQKNGLTEEKIQSKLSGTWKLSDLAIITLPASPGKDGTKNLKRVPRVNDLQLRFQDDGSVISNEVDKGRWRIVNDRLLIEFNGEESFDTKITTLEPGFLVLEESYGLNSEGKNGIVYFAFAR